LPYPAVLLVNSLSRRLVQQSPVRSQFLDVPVYVNDLLVSQQAFPRITSKEVEEVVIPLEPLKLTLLITAARDGTAEAEIQSISWDGVTSPVRG
jgi:hypothetical protein